MSNSFTLPICSWWSYFIIHYEHRNHERIYFIFIPINTQLLSLLFCSKLKEYHFSYYGQFYLLIPIVFFFSILCFFSYSIWLLHIIKFSFSAYYSCQSANVYMSYLKKNSFYDFLHLSHLWPFHNKGYTYTHLYIYTIFITKNSIPLSHSTIFNISSTFICLISK